MKASHENSGQIAEDALYTRSFHSLGLRDLLDARDQFHVHLVHKRNVIATAIGLYLIRESDPDSSTHAGLLDAVKRRGTYNERTLENTSVKPWSWPCVLVFVSQWQKLEDLQKHPESVVPPFLYLQDGRIVPVCVVKANTSRLPARMVDSSKLLAACLEGGSPIFVEAQGQRRMGSVGCIVSNGTDYFALTNRHVAGEGGREIKAIFNGIPAVVGITDSSLKLEEPEFTKVYEELAGRNTVVHLDAGLVHLTDVTQWNPTVGGQMVGEMADFSAETASLDWIGAHVVAHGAASGDLQGEIRALFYRYKSVGGREYVSEFLIGSRSDCRTAEVNDGSPAPESNGRQPLMTVPGDSGTLWCLDAESTPDHVLRPVALEWGGQRLNTDPTEKDYLQFCLASSVAVICRELGLDIVNDFRTEHAEYWGAVGHFKIAQQACFQVTDPDLKSFAAKNLNNISFQSDANLLAAHLQASKFVPLSDVPDIVWKTNVNKVKRAVTRAQENWNHFADMDLPGADGKTLLDMFSKSEDSVQWSTWIKFYKSAPHPTEQKGNTLSQGSLPFRVWQIFEAMKALAEKKDQASFLCAMGIIAHYCGDACQTLHCSQHADGLNGASTGVHSTYEDNMVEHFADDIASGIDDIFKTQDFTPAAIGNGREAAIAVVQLMQRCHVALPPEKICESYNNARPGSHSSATKSVPVLTAMWKDCGQGTITCIADGIRTLASIWQSAAGADTSWLTDTFDGTKDLMPIYEDTGFLLSQHLANYTQAMIPGSDAPGGEASVAASTGTKSAGTKSTGSKAPGRKASGSKASDTPRHPVKRVRHVAKKAKGAHAGGR